MEQFAFLYDITTGRFQLFTGPFDDYYRPLYFRFQPQGILVVSRSKIILVSANVTILQLGAEFPKISIIFLIYQSINVSTFNCLYH